MTLPLGPECTIIFRFSWENRGFHLPSSISAGTISPDVQQLTWSTFAAVESGSRESARLRYLWKQLFVCHKQEVGGVGGLDRREGSEERDQDPVFVMVEQCRDKDEDIWIFVASGFNHYLINRSIVSPPSSWKCQIKCQGGYQLKLQSVMLWGNLVKLSWPCVFLCFLKESFCFKFTLSTSETCNWETYLFSVAFRRRKSRQVFKSLIEGRVWPDVCLFRGGKQEANLFLSGQANRKSNGHTNCCYSINQSISVLIYMWWRRYNAIKLGETTRPIYFPDSSRLYIYIYLCLSGIHIGTVN